MRRILPVLLVLLGLLVVAAQAQPASDVISFQGRLTDANGQPVSDGAYQLQFHLYDQPAGGTLQWSETQVVTTQDGVFTALLGSVSPLAGLSFEEGYYVALGVNGSAELSPRTALAAVPYALRAQRLDASALEAGSNVTITRQNDGALRIEAAGGGTGGGLTRVSTDATLAGEGTASSPLGLADGSVTGAKLADTALRAGSNTTITRQGDGSLEIAAAATPLRLPFSGSASSSQPVLNIENTGEGHGIHVTPGTGAGSAGVSVDATGRQRGMLVNGGLDGVFVDQASFSGVFMDNMGTYGLYVNSAGLDGLFVNSAQQIGLHIANAAQSGVHVNQADNGIRIIQANNDGVLVESAGQYGLNVQNAFRGVDINTTTDDGVVVRNAGQHGLRILDARVNGLQIDLAGSNGIQIGQTTFDGIQIQSPGRDGIRVSGAGGLAGRFGGDVEVTGTLSKGGGSFKIDHPLDPAGRYLSHSFVESPDMMNVYNGNVVTDASGEAVVELPDYFEALNRDFRYGLTVIGTFAQAIVAEEIRGNRFVIRTDQPGVKVSWQITGIRQDAWANEHRIVVEAAKPVEERGYYLHPEALGLPVEWGLTARAAARRQSPPGSH